MPHAGYYRLIHHAVGAGPVSKALAPPATVIRPGRRTHSSQTIQTETPVTAFKDWGSSASQGDGGRPGQIGLQGAAAGRVPGLVATKMSGFYGVRGMTWTQTRVH